MPLNLRKHNQKNRNKPIKQAVLCATCKSGDSLNQINFYCKHPRRERLIINYVAGNVRVCTEYRGVLA